MKINEVKAILEKIPSKKLNSIIIYGSFLYSEKYNDIDVFIISNKKLLKKEKTILDEISLKYNIEFLVLEKDQFKSAVLDFNPQLIPIFTIHNIIKR